MSLTSSKRKPERTVVVWSGGADSTALLDHYAGISCEDYPVIAVSVTRHPYLSRPFLKKQNEVQLRYLAHAKKKGYHIRHNRVRFGGNFEFGIPSVQPQAMMWISAMAQIVADSDTVMMGYIRGDDFWHINEAFGAVFSAICRFKGIDSRLKFPFEWDHKVDILERLQKGKVPGNCWFSCDHTRGRGACGKCSKCEVVKSAQQELRLRKKFASKKMLVDRNI